MNLYNCQKIPYINRREAVATMKLHSLQHGQPYKCRHCGFWHLGNKIPKKSDIGKIIENNKKNRRAIKRLFQLIDWLCGGRK